MTPKPKNLTLCGQTVPFDGVPRLAEIEAYDAAIQQGGRVLDLVKAMAPAIINTRLKPAQTWMLEGHTPVTEACALGVLEVVRSIQEVLTGPKVMSALAGMTPGAKTSTGTG